MKTEWITGDEPMGQPMVDWADNFGFYLVKGHYDKQDDFKKRNFDALTTSQIRKFFGETKRIQADWSKHSMDAPMLNARLAYAVGRKKKSHKTTYAIEEFANKFHEPIFKASESKDNFDRFVKILEATVAYHKFHGGKD